MQCVFEGSSLKFAGVDGDIINAHDKNHTAGCDKGKNEFLKFCFWHSKPSLTKMSPIRLTIDKRHFMSYLFYQVLEFNVIGILHKI